MLMVVSPFSERAYTETMTAPAMLGQAGGSVTPNTVYMRTPKNSAQRLATLIPVTDLSPLAAVPSESRSDKKERTRRAILDAALHLTEDTGLAGLSLRQVAKEV